MTVAGVVAAGRRRAEALMDCTCTITRGAGRAGQDETTGRRTDATAGTVYTGKCRVQLGEVAPDQAEAGDRTWTTERATVSIPVTSTSPVTGDVVQITTAPLDPFLVGRRYRVVVAPAKSHATARRLACERIAG